MTNFHGIQFMTNQNVKFMRLHAIKQRGVVLFLALMALVVMSLAAVALIRSVDTSSLIAGNLAFKQAATTSADAGVEAAITSITGMVAGSAGLDIMNATGHLLNTNNLAVRPGYYSYLTNLDLFAAATWDNDINNSNNNSVNSALLPIDGSGNKIRYIIQRMCRNPGAVKDADCLFATAVDDTSGQQIKQISDICEGPGCYFGGKTPQIRVTVRVTGPKNTVSYVQAFVY